MTAQRKREHRILGAVVGYRELDAVPGSEADAILNSVRFG